MAPARAVNQSQSRSMQAVDGCRRELPDHELIGHNQTLRAVTNTGHRPVKQLKELWPVKKDVWVPAVVVPLIIVPAALLIFFGIAVGLELFHDYSLGIGTVLFIGISLGAWLLARRTETAHAQSNPTESADHH